VTFQCQENHQNREPCGFVSAAKASPPGAEACEGDDKPGVPPHHPYSPDLVHAGFFILPKEERTTGRYQVPLANITMTQDTFKSNLERAIRIITT
jgi:hypothetical protein